ncbi:chorismate lyase [uncultured Methanobrevibacter sp.]|uniref:chorismate--pyruvate lyase family protein n=1 Tax=uncultured Methanobrevibacter sp. TaxID=253161 RepID=UPI0025D4EED2|nr:chorismate lyase [uncultured Methanobrevibacter sp.]MCI6994540.1 chorismate lyase [Methanobrevibacter sp.]
MSEPKNEANRGLIDKINQVEKEYGRNFSNTQKILMTTDGSITAILDVLYGKITLSTLDQHFEDADKDHAKLVNVDEGEEINYREVIMHRDGKPLIYAISHIPLSRCTKDVCADLIRADIPIGRILKNYHIESRREIKNIWIEKPNETLKELFGTDEDMLARDYVIINQDRILMWIKEVFPISYFTEI